MGEERDMEWILTQLNMMGKAFVGLTLPDVAHLDGPDRPRVAGRVRPARARPCRPAILAGHVRPGVSGSDPVALIQSSFYPLADWQGSPHRDSARLGASDCLRRRGPQRVPMRWANPTSSTPAHHTHAPLSPPTTGQTGLSSANDRGQEPSQTTLGGVGERPRTLSWQGSDLSALADRRRRSWAAC